MCINRLSKANLVSDIMVATSNESSDQDIVDYCKSIDIPCYLGSLNDVGLRLLNAAVSCKQENFLRICGDSPFIDPAIINHAISISKTSDFDIVTNVFPRSFPKGQSVEVIRTKAMQQVCNKKRTKGEKEHATSYFYENYKNYRICSFSSGFDEAESNLSIDDEKDYKIAKYLLEFNEMNELGWKEIQKLWNAQKVKENV